MKIEQAEVAMNASRNFSREYAVKFDSERTFRKIYDGVAQSEKSSGSAKAERDTEVLMMLEALIARMIAFISGSQGVQVTDLREVLKTDNAALSEKRPERPARAVEMEWKSEFTETIREHESTGFNSSGTIRTQDGRKLEFNLELNMCRDFTCERKTTDSGKVVLRDPLIINFDGKAAELSGKRFAFDLDADGITELIPGLGNGSGFLAFDSNADGRINNGRELFGTRSGNGFADLVALDDDGNHWLDENDAAFSGLSVWQRDVAGQDRLSSLHEKGVGALYLGSTESLFALTDAENRLLAQIRSSGFYLREDGGAGLLQQVDFAV